MIRKGMHDLIPYRSTSPERKRIPLGPYRRPMPRVRRGSQGGGRFLMGEVPLYLASTVLHVRIEGARGTSALLLLPKDAERRENNLQRVNDFNLEAKARIWPLLSYVCHIGPREGGTSAVLFLPNDACERRCVGMPPMPPPGPENEPCESIGPCCPSRACFRRVEFNILTNSLTKNLTNTSRVGFNYGTRQRLSRYLSLRSG